MQILHTQWIPPNIPEESGSVFFWSETSELPQLDKIDRRKKGTKPHPFVGGYGHTAALLRTQLSDYATGEQSIQTLLLPAGKYGPLPSPGLIHEWDLSDRSKVKLSPWLIEGVLLEPEQAFMLLMKVPNQRDLPPWLTLGPGTRYWLTVAELVLEAITQHKVLPTLVQVDMAGKEFHARWMPVLDGPRDGPRISQLLEAMPPLCRATGDNPLAALPPRQLFDTFVNVMGDAMMRQWGRPSLSTDYLPTSLPNSPAGNWLKALVAKDPTVKGSAAQLSRLHSSHQAWLRNLHAAGDQHFRVGFRLEAPLQQAANTETVRAVSSDNGAANWGLHFLLQARDDPSLLAPAADVWASGTQSLQILNRHFDQPQQKLLTGLGFATRLFPPLERGLQTGQPTEVMLSSEEAYTFLREASPLLVDSGFAVLSPPW